LEYFLNFYKIYEKTASGCQRYFKRVLCKYRKASTNRKRGISLSCFQKSFVNSKAFGVKRIRIAEFSTLLKGEFKNIE
jgi:hypothetical protein